MLNSVKHAGAQKKSCIIEVGSEGGRIWRDYCIYKISKLGRKILFGHKELFFILKKTYKQSFAMTLKPIFSIFIFEILTFSGH